MKGKQWLCLSLALLLCIGAAVAEEAEDEDWSIVENVILTPDGQEIPDPTPVEEVTDDTAVEEEPAEYTPRDDFIDRIIALGQEKHEEAGGRAQRAHYAEDIYVCKNFTVYLFRQNRDDFRMAEYPDTTLVIPNNLPSAECKPYSYGLAWEDIPASEGNPFYEAASFRYNTELSEEENMELALEFMRQVKKGDFFQMSAKYEYGTGAHSAIMISDYDPETDTVHWMDSNMRGKRVDGIRYGIVQFDEEKSIQWWAECFCQKTRGATLYRLRDDIIYASDVQ